MNYELDKLSNIDNQHSSLDNRIRNDPLENLSMWPGTTRVQRIAAVEGVENGFGVKVK
jgi:hypothetical protein